MFRSMLKKSIHKSQHCNRNWDLSKKIPQEDIDLIIEAATQCPTKQNLNHYKTHVITDRAVIEKIEAASSIMEFGSADNSFLGFDGVRGYDEGTGPTNSQLSANLVLAFTKDTPYQPSRDGDEAIRQSAETDEEMGKQAETYRDDLNQAVGIAAGYVNLASVMLGYSTGCCKCFDRAQVKEALGETREPVLLMGVGVSDPKRQRQEHHTDSSFRFGSHKNMRTYETHYA